MRVKRKFLPHGNLYLSGVGRRTDYLCRLVVEPTLAPRVGHSGGVAYGRIVVDTGLSQGGGANDGAGAGRCCPSVYDSWTTGRSSRCETFGFYVGSRGRDNPVVEHDSFSATQDLQW